MAANEPVFSLKWISEIYPITRIPYQGMAYTSMLS